MSKPPIQLLMLWVQREPEWKFPGTPRGSETSSAGMGGAGAWAPGRDGSPPYQPPKVCVLVCVCVCVCLLFFFNPPENYGFPGSFN